MWETVNVRWGCKIEEMCIVDGINEDKGCREWYSDRLHQYLEQYGTVVRPEA